MASIFDILFQINPTLDLFDITNVVNAFGLNAASGLSGIHMFYGGYGFQPVPVITSSKRAIKTGNQRNIGTTYGFTLNGTLLDLDNGISGVIDEIRELRNAFNADGRHFQIKCGDTVLLDGYPRVLGLQINESPDNWVMTADYSVDIEFDDYPDPDVDPVYDEYIQDFSEEWNIEFDQARNYYELNLASGTDIGPYMLRLTHNISAQGKSHYSGPGLNGTLDKPAWQQAKDYISTRLGMDENIVFSNSLNLSSGDFGYYDHFRGITTDETNGTYAINETWAILYTGHGGLQRAATEDFTVNIQKNNNAELNSVTIDGTIQGLESRTYNNSGIGDFSISQYKFDAAENYFNNLTQYGYIVSRAQNLAADEEITLNTDPVISLIGKNPTNGIVTYNYTFDDRPTNCITGAKFESIVINNENPADVFNEIVVMGRPQGPIIQKMNTVTATNRSVNISLLMENKGSCVNLTGGPHSQVDAILCSIYTDLTGNYDKVFKSADSESWNPKNGRYNRTVAWTATDCDDIPDTTFC